eukprot:3937772-Amphidinium_carterae.1
MMTRRDHNTNDNEHNTDSSNGNGNQQQQQQQIDRERTVRIVFEFIENNSANTVWKGEGLSCKAREQQQELQKDAELAKEDLTTAHARLAVLREAGKAGAEAPH